MRRFRFLISIVALLAALCGLEPATAGATTNTGYDKYGWISPIPKESVTTSIAYTADMRTPAFTIYRSGGWAWTQYVTVDYYVYQDGYDGWAQYAHKLTYGYISPGSSLIAPLRGFEVDRARNYHFAMKVTWYTAAGAYLGATWYDYNAPSDYLFGTNVQSINGYVNNNGHNWYSVFPF